MSEIVLKTVNKFNKPQTPGERHFKFIILIIFSIHIAMGYYLSAYKIDRTKVKSIEDLAPRAIKMLKLDKMPKKKKEKQSKKIENKNKLESSKKSAPIKKEKVAEIKKQKQVKVAKKKVARRAAVVRQKVRNYGVLKVLGGMGPSRNRKRSRATVGDFSLTNSNLGSTLKGMKGLRVASDADLGSKLDRNLKGRNLVGTAAIGATAVSSGFSAPTIGKMEKIGSIKISRPKKVGAAVNSARRSDKEITKIIKKIIPGIRARYKRALRSNPSLKGKITVQFTITASGNIKDVEIIVNTLNEPSLEQKIIMAIKRLKFPVIEESEGEITLTYPFVLEP